MMKWLITGGLGFIGTNLAKCIKSIHTTDRIVSVDTFKGATNESNGLYDNGYKQSVCALGNLSDIFESEKPDIVVHLASVTEPRLSVKRPYKVMKENFSGALNVLGLSRDNDVKTVIVASSCGVAGEVSSYVNRNSVAFPTNPYTHSKAIVESLCSCYSNLGLSVNIARFSNVYGPYSERKTSSIAKFCKDILTKKKVDIFGDGGQRRDFIYVDDLCKGLIRLADIAVKRRVSTRYCFGSGNSRSINEVIDIFGSLAKGGFDTVYKSSNSFEINSIDVDTSHTRLELYWQPETTLFAGVGKTFLWFRDNMNLI